MKLFIKLMLLLLLPAFLKAQQNPYWQEPTKTQADSLRNLFQNSGNDSLRMYSFRQLGLYYQEINRDSSLYFFEQQLLVAQKLKLKIWEAEAYKGIGYVSCLLGNYPRSLKSLLTAKDIASEKGIEKNIWKISQFSKEEDPFKSRMTLLAGITQTLGFLYTFTGDFEKGLPYYFECREIAKDINDKALLSLVNMNIGEAYLFLGKPDSALVAEQNAYDYCIQSGYEKYKGFILYLTGSIHVEKGNYVTAKKYFSESIQTTFNQQSLDVLGMGYIAAANLFLKTRNTDSGFYYAKKGLYTYQVLGDPPGLIRAYESLSSLYESEKNTDSAFFYQKVALTIQDSLNNAEKVRNFQNIGFNEQLKLQELEKEKIQTANKIRTYSMLAGIGVFMLVAFLLYRNNRNRKKANELLIKQKDEIEVQKKNVEQTLTELKSTQAHLIQSEKMASLGELTAGIAHEIQNPLNFVNNFSEVNTELIEELEQEAHKGNIDEVKSIAKDIKENEQKINHHGKRADAIVKGMLQHSQKSSGQKESTNINALCDEYLRLAYHGLKAKDKDFNATMKPDFDSSIGKVNIIPQDIGRVILNLYNNAFYAVAEKKKLSNENYEPTISVSTKKINDKVEIKVKDNGMGIPQNIIDKIFQPFFTTKPTGQGTGLGLSLAYDIMKAHGGEIKVESKEVEGTEFIIQLPII